MTAPRWQAIVPGLATVRGYRREWLRSDLAAGFVLAAVLVPVGMGYAQASGLPAVAGLYATIVPLLAYALFGPSRVLVLGPDSTLAGVIAALILPLALGSDERALALAAALALMAGALLLLLGLLRLGLVADLLSKPIRIGFLNAIALTVLIGQLPLLLGLPSDGGALGTRAWGLLSGLLQGQWHATTAAVGLASLAGVLLLRRDGARVPGSLVAVVGATGLSAALALPTEHGVAVVGGLPAGLPRPAWPAITLADWLALAPGAAMIALLVFADSSVLSRTLAAREQARVDSNQELRALALANVASGLCQGFPVSASASRTPVAIAAGARTQVAAVVAAAAVATLLVLAPQALQHLPRATLAAVVIVACLALADIGAMWALRRQRPVEFVLSLVSFVGVAFVGVIEGVVLAIVLSLAVLVWNTWHPYSAVLVQVPGREGWHDQQRHPEGLALAGLLLFRWDAELFFANAEVFRGRLEQALHDAPIRCVVVAADAISDIDVTASDMLVDLDAELERRGIELRFAGLKGPVKDRLVRYGLQHRFDPTHFDETVASAVAAYQARFAQPDRAERPQ